MGYTALRVPQIKANVKQPTTTFDKITLDLKDLPQLMSPKAALQITNYVQTYDGGLMKRRGIQSIVEVASVYPVTMLFSYTADIWIFGYNTTVAAYQVSTDTVTNIKTNFAAGSFTGVRYGDYAFVCNKTEAIGRLSRTLAYDTQTANFTVNKIVTGQTSGATAVILQDSDSGVTGTLTLGDIQGTFQDNEIITDSSGGSATANGTVTWTYTSVSGAPTCGVLATSGGRLFAGDLSDDSSGVKYSDQDTGANPPFQNWTTGTGGADPGKVFYRASGQVKAINFLGSNVVVLAAQGKWSFTITTNNINGTIYKVDQWVLQRVDMGGCRASVVTPKGMIYANKGGMWRIASLGQSNVPYSEQEDDPATLLGSDYFVNVNLDDADIIYDARVDSVYLTVAKDSDVNNYVVCLNLTTGTMSEFTGWNINRFMNINQTIYGASANTVTIYECMAGYDDDGTDIWTYFYQELQTGNLETRKKMTKQYMDAFVVPNAPLQVAFDIYDVQGNFVANKLGMDFVCTNAPGSGDGYGQLPYGSGSFGGDEDLAGMIEYFDGGSGFIRNYQRLRVKILGHDKFPHKLVWIKEYSEEKLVPIRKRSMIQTTS